MINLSPEFDQILIKFMRQITADFIMADSEIGEEDLRLSHFYDRLQSYESRLKYVHNKTLVMNTDAKEIEYKALSNAFPL